MRRASRQNRGMLLVSSYLLLSVFLMYANMMTLRAITQRMASEGYRALDQSRNLAQAAIEQLQEDLYQFLDEQIYGEKYNMDADLAMRWLDSLNAVAKDLTGATPEKDSHQLRLPTADRTNDSDSVITWADGVAQNGFVFSPRCVTDLATSGKMGPTTVTGRCLSAAGAPPPPVEAPRAWIVSVGRDEDIDGDGVLDPGEDDPNNGGVKGVLDQRTGTQFPRYVTFEAEARAGGSASVTTRLRATYEFTLGGVTNVFRHAYFRNNSATLEMPGGSMLEVYGEIGTNGDMSFPGSRVRVFGDLYASKNPDAMQLTNGSAQTGDIITVTGAPAAYPVWMSESPAVAYWRRKPPEARPIRDIVLAGQPAIGGPKSLPSGSAWDVANGVQKAPYQTIEPVPYLGNLEYYKALATQQGSWLTYSPVDPNDTTGGVINAVHPNANGRPLLLVGTTTKPIEIHGPVVVTGDVIIRGVVKGRGTIYSGRNTHISGELLYKDRPRYDPLERAVDTAYSYNNDGRGAIYPHHGVDSDPSAPAISDVLFGTVCDNGTYIAPGGPGSCP